MAVRRSGEWRGISGGCGGGTGRSGVAAFLVLFAGVVLVMWVARSSPGRAAATR